MFLLDEIEFIVLSYSTKRFYKEKTCPRLKPGIVLPFEKLLNDGTPYGNGMGIVWEWYGNSNGVSLD